MSEGCLIQPKDFGVSSTHHLIREWNSFHNMYGPEITETLKRRPFYQDSHNYVLYNLKEPSIIVSFCDADTKSIEAAKLITKDWP